MIEHSILVNRIGVECLCPCRCGCVFTENNYEEFVGGICGECLLGKHEIPPFNPEDLKKLSSLAFSFAEHLDKVSIERKIETMRKVMKEE